MPTLPPFPSYKPSGIDWLGGVPEHWEVARTDYYLTETRNSVSQELLRGKKVFHYSIPAVQEVGNGIVEDGENIDSSKTVINTTTLLISKLNPRKGTIIVAHPSKYLTVCSGEFIPLVPDGMEINYAEYIYKSEAIRQLLASQVVSVTKSHQRVKPDQIKKIWWAFPPLPEQHTIADFLDRQTAKIDDLIAKKEQLIARLKEKRQAVITQAVTKGLDSTVPMKDSSIDWLGDVPEHWEVKRLKYLADLLNGYAFDSQTYVDDGIPIIRIGDVSTDIKWDEVKRVPHELGVELKRFLVEKHDILLALTGATIGKSSSFRYDQSALLNQRVGIIRANKINQRLLSYFVLSASFSKVIDFLCYGGAQENIGREEVGGISISLAAAVEQEAIADFLDRKTTTIDALVAKVETALGILKEYRTALITAAVTGKIDVRGEGE